MVNQRKSAIIDKIAYIAHMHESLIKSNYAQQKNRWFNEFLETH